MLNSTFANIIYIGAATKSITNDNIELKDTVLFNVLGQEGLKNYNKFFCHPEMGPKFDQHTENVFLKNAQIIKALDKGYDREFEEDLHLPDVSIKLTEWDGVAR